MNLTVRVFLSKADACSPFRSKKGFTLVELAMVLIIIGLLVGLSAGLIGPLTKRVKYTESREVVKTAKEALLGYAVKNGYLPLSTNPDPLGLAGARKMDAWGRDLSYAADSTLMFTSTNACNRTSTDRTIFECTNTACTTANTKSNIAFIVYSTGEDADGVGTTTQPTAGPACPVTVPVTICYWLREQVSSDASYTLQYDDIVQYVSLDEIRSAMGCVGDPMIPNAPVFGVGEGANRATLSGINLTWTTPTFNTDGSNLVDLSGYQIYRSIDGGATYSLLQSIGTGISYTDTSLTAGQRHVYRMRAVDKAGNSSADSLTTSTTVSPIIQTVATAWSQPANEATCGAGTNRVPNCATAANRRRKALFTIRNTGNALDNGANIVVNSIVIEWGTTGGTVRKILVPDGSAPNEYCSTAGTASGITIPLTLFTINAGASTTIGIYWCTSGAQPTEVRRIQFNTADGALSLY